MELDVVVLVVDVVDEVVGGGGWVVVVVVVLVVVVDSLVVVLGVVEVVVLDGGDVDDVVLLPVVVVRRLVLPRTHVKGRACNRSLGGATKLPVSVPPTAARMNRCQIVAGKEPPVTCRPWTSLILRSVPSL